MHDGASSVQVMHHFRTQVHGGVMRLGVVVRMGIPRLLVFLKVSLVDTREESGRKPMDLVSDTSHIKAANSGYA